LPEYFSVYYDDMNVNVDFSIYGVQLKMCEYDNLEFGNISQITKKDIKDISKNTKYPIIIINPVFKYDNTNLIDHVSLGMRNKD
jgi:hypothetical protein